MEEIQSISNILNIDNDRYMELHNDFTNYIKNYGSFTGAIGEFLNSTQTYEFEEVFLMGFFFGRQIESNERHHKLNKLIKQLKEDN